jgi:hypothetical protein
MKHVITKPNGRDLGFGCSCGNRFATQKLADKHAEDQNLLEENAAMAKAEAAKMEGSADRVAPSNEPTEAAQPAASEPTERPTRGRRCATVLGARRASRRLLELLPYYILLRSLMAILL